MIDLRRLRVLRAVAHYGTVTAAAQALHFTPSAASQQIRQLGRELGVTLLEPYGRNVQLTAPARRLLDHADAIEERWERAEADLQATGDEPAGLLCLIAFPTAISTLLAPVTVALRDKYPMLDVCLQEAEEPDAYDRLFQGEVDLAVTEASRSTPSLGDSRFCQRPLLDDTYDLVVAASHPYATRESVHLADAAKEGWIASSPDTTCHDHLYAACTAAGFTPTVSHRAREWSAIAHLVAYELGVALVPRLVDLPPHLPVTRVQITGESRPRRKVLTVTRPGARERPAVAAALEELERLAPSATTTAKGGLRPPAHPVAATPK